MADNETIADIIAKKRQYADDLERACNEIVAKDPSMVEKANDYKGTAIADIRREADRLEAAHKRERGNCARLREAVKAAYDKMLLWNYTDGDTARMALGVMNNLDAALSAPPRNCDRFATVDEARKAHEAICEKYDKCHNGCPLNNEEHYSAFDCFEAWLYAPSTEKEGGVK